VTVNVTDNIALLIKELEDLFLKHGYEKGDDAHHTENYTDAIMPEVIALLTKYRLLGVSAEAISTDMNVTAPLVREYTAKGTVTPMVARYRRMIE
jgi:hypothetical protein